MAKSPLQLAASPAFPPSKVPHQILTRGEPSSDDEDDEEDAVPVRKFRVTAARAKANFATVKPISEGLLNEQKKEHVPAPVSARAGRLITRSQRLIDIVLQVEDEGEMEVLPPTLEFDSDDDLPDLVSGYESGDAEAENDELIELMVQ